MTDASSTDATTKDLKPDAHTPPGTDPPHAPRTEDWDPRTPEVLKDQISAYDDLRGHCPVAWSTFLGWTVHRHADVVAVVEDDETYSNEVSAHLSVPNGMDPPEHTAYRTIVDRYFTAARMDTFEPICRTIAADLVAALPRNQRVEIMEDLARTFALRRR